MPPKEDEKKYALALFLGFAFSSSFLDRRTSFSYAEGIVFFRSPQALAFFVSPRTREVGVCFTRFFPH